MALAVAALVSVARDALSRWFLLHNLFFVLNKINGIEFRKKNNFLLDSKSRSNVVGYEAVASLAYLNQLLSRVFALLAIKVENAEQFRI